MNMPCYRQLETNKLKKERPNLWMIFACFPRVNEQIKGSYCADTKWKLQGKM
jgi:hypothetical protein